MLVITTACQKGGVGKTTLTINLAAEALKQGGNPLIMEVDRQGSASSWAEKRNGTPPDVKRISGHSIKRAISAAEKEGRTVVFIDLPGTHSPSVAWAIEASDFVIIPTRASDGDLDATIETRRAVADQGKHCGFVFTHIGAVKSNSATVAKSTAKGFGEIGETVSPVHMRSHDDFGRVLDEGRTVHEVAPNGQTAKDIARIWEWVKQQSIEAKELAA